MQKKLVVLMALGHLVTDINQGALPALLPFLIATRHFSYATAAGLVFMANLASSVTQPFFGHLADRYAVSWLVPAGILTAGIGVVLAAVVPAYWVMLLAVALSGIGVAAFHPEATLIVNRFSGTQKATAMSMFAVGGTLGFALGPLLTTACVLWLGFRGALLLVIPGLVAAAIIGMQTAHLSTPSATGAGLGPSPQGSRDAWWPFACLTLTVIFRSVVFFGLNTFLALYWIGWLQQTKSAGNTALSILLLSGATGTLLGGRSADLWGRGWVLTASLFFVPALLLMLLTTTRVSVATILLVPLGLLLFAPFGVMVVMAQEYLPNHPGVASGVTYGLAASVGGIATPIFGRIADRYGLHASLSALTLVACVAFLFAVATVRSGRAHLLQEARVPG